MIVTLLEEVDGKLKLNEANLERVLDAGRLKNLPIAVISIAGAFRMGKSFLLNLFLRYFRKQAWQPKNGSWLNDWKSSEDAGIKWQGGAEGHTRGIGAWSEPFIVRRSDGSELAVILLDTQGNFEQGRSRQENIGIFALSTLFSSLQIFNVSKQIQTNDLEYLQCFVEFSKLAQPKDSNVDDGEVSHQRCFFQDLLFLVRDWQNPVTHPYGIDGGKDYLKTISCPSSEVPAHKYLSDAFSRTQCYLMPEPSGKVRIAESKEQILSSSDLGIKFFDHVLHLASEYIHPDKLHPRSFGFSGNVTAAFLLRHIKSCAKNVLSGPCPEFPSIMALIAANANAKALEKVEEQYKAETVKAIKNMQGPTWRKFDTMVENNLFKARTVFMEQTSYGREEFPDGGLKTFEYRIKTTYPTITIEMEQRRCSFMQSEIQMWLNESCKELESRQHLLMNTNVLKKIRDERLLLLPPKDDRDLDKVTLLIEAAKKQLDACCDKHVGYASAIKNILAMATTMAVVAVLAPAAAPIAAVVVVGSTIAFTARWGLTGAAKLLTSGVGWFFTPGGDTKKKKSD